MYIYIYMHTHTYSFNTHTYTHTYAYTCTIHTHQITKGALIRHVVNHYNNRGGVDFILCLGDDNMEKDMFTTLDQYQREAQFRVYRVP